MEPFFFFSCTTFLGSFPMTPLSSSFSFSHRFLFLPTRFQSKCNLVLYTLCFSHPVILFSHKWELQSQHYSRNGHVYFSTVKKFAFFSFPLENDKKVRVMTVDLLPVSPHGSQKDHMCRNVFISYKIVQFLFFVAK